MKIKKEINPKLTETELYIKTWSELEFQKIYEKFDGRVKIKTAEGTFLINRPDILYVEAKRNDLELHLKEQTFKVRSPLYKMKEVLGRDFVQVSRSYLINFQRLSAVEADLVHGMIARVSGVKVPISRAYLKNIYEKMEEMK